MIQVREYARVTTDASATSSLDLGVVSQTTFDWLVELNKQSNTGRLFTLDGHQHLKLNSYVGYLQSPAGEAIEILPKTRFGAEHPQAARQVLRKMLCSALRLKPKEFDSAYLQRMDTPLHEWIFGHFLVELDRLVVRGLRFDYQRVEEESRFIRGQLNIAAQQRQTPERAHLFHIRHDIYSPDRIENRLLKAALDIVCRCCRHPENWRLANELTHILEPISKPHDPLNDLAQWTDSKLFQAYQAIKPWCRLILEQLNPNFQQGAHRGISLLFPMERLFETHAAACISQQVLSPWKLKVQPASKHLVAHQPINTDKDSPWFTLKPDLMLINSSSCQVMDTKWKLLNEMASTSEAKYQLSQQDFYQLFAYGQKYQKGVGDMMLIYPRHPEFTNPLPCFHFDDELRLWVVPFCIERDQLAEGEWMDAFPSIQVI